jgi:NAD-dependent DNA ligase
MNIEGLQKSPQKTYLITMINSLNLLKTSITIEKKVEAVKVGNDLEDMSFVFTGVRRTDLEQIIESRGGKIGSAVSKIHHLVMKSKDQDQVKKTRQLH